MSSSDDTDLNVFASALERPAGERAAYVEQACGGDPERRARINSLLEAHDAGAGLLTRPLARATARLLREETAGDSIGPYKLLLKIGEGGCGVVFMAEQDEPVRRRVALKVIKAGMDTREVIARFEAERQALALMDHPGICKVLDAGATAAGRPFFVMELVRGVPITKYCDENQLPTTARLELFTQVCDAVQHAHQKGIIHRDLKPSNILVTLHGTTASPKVIDFGIAKATQGRLTDSTLVTAFEQFLGTPAYMSPEQAEMSPLDIDTRSDVYSLGVLLYELLTGRPPFDPKSLMVASRDELRRIIREVEPPRPSSHLSTLAAADRTTVAQRRSTDLAKLRLILAGDLDWIVMKALEKNRVRRYETPAALADDIKRHLGNEPVVARPPGKLYRAGKFIRRHRYGVTALTAVGVVLVAGTIVSTWQAVRATRAEKVGEVERANAVEARKRADKLLAFMLNLRSEVQKVGKLDLLELVGDQATDYFASLDPRDLSDDILLQHVKSLRQIAEVQVSKARYAEANATLDAALARASTLAARNPLNGEVLYERGQVEYWIGFLHRRRGDFAPAAQWLTRYRDTALALSRLDPTNIEWQRERISGRINLAVLEMARGNVAESRQALLQEMAVLDAMCAAHPTDLRFPASLANICSWLGAAAEREGDFGEALSRYGEQTTRLEALLARDPKNMERKFRVAVSMSLAVDVLAITLQRAEARRRLAQAIALFESLVQHDSANQRWQINALEARFKEVALDSAEGKLSDAIRKLNELRPKIEALAAAEPSDLGFVARLVTAWRLEAELRLASGRNDAADAAAFAADRAMALLEEARRDQEVMAECALAHVIAAEIARSRGNRELAARHAQRVLDLIARPLADSRNWRLLDPAARALVFLGRADESRAIVERLQQLGYRPLRPWPEVRL